MEIKCNPKCKISDKNSNCPSVLLDVLWLYVAAGFSVGRAMFSHRDHWMLS